MLFSPVLSFHHLGFHLSPSAFGGRIYSNKSAMSDQAKSLRPEFDYEEESTSKKLARKTKDNPLMVIGLTGCAFVVAYGFYKYRNRGKLSTSNYLMQLRVTAQGAVIGCLTLGVLKSLYDHYSGKKTESD